MKTRNTYLLLIILITGVACQTLIDTGRILARPALTVLVQQLVQDSSEWRTVISIVDAILSEALHSSPPPSSDAIEATIDRLVGAYAPGTEDQRTQFLTEVSAALSSDQTVSSGYPPEDSIGLQVLHNSIAAALK